MTHFMGTEPRPIVVIVWTLVVRQIVDVYRPTCAVSIRCFMCYSSPIRLPHHTRVNSDVAAGIRESHHAVKIKSRNLALACPIGLESVRHLVCLLLSERVSVEADTI